MEGFMRFAEFADAMDRLLGEAGPGDFLSGKLKLLGPFPQVWPLAFCGVLFRRLVVFLFLSGRLLRWVV